MLARASGYQSAPFTVNEAQRSLALHSLGLNEEADGTSDRSFCKAKAYARHLSVRLSRAFAHRAVLDLAEGWQSKGVNVSEKSGRTRGEKMHKVVPQRSKSRLKESKLPRQQLTLLREQQ